MIRLSFYTRGFALTMALVLALCAAPLFVSVPDALAGQTFTVSDDAPSGVRGNGPDPQWRAD